MSVSPESVSARRWVGRALERGVGSCAMDANEAGNSAVRSSAARNSIGVSVPSVRRTGALVRRALPAPAYPLVRRKSGTGPTAPTVNRIAAPSSRRPSRSKIKKKCAVVLHIS